MYTVSVVDHAEELDLFALDVALVLVEDQTHLFCHFHQLMEVAIVLVLVFAIDNDVICDAKGSRTLAEDLVHVVFEYVLAYAQAKR